MTTATAPTASRSHQRTATRAKAVCLGAEVVSDSTNRTGSGDQSVVAPSHINRRRSHRLCESASIAETMPSHREVAVELMPAAISGPTQGHGLPFSDFNRTFGHDSRNPLLHWRLAPITMATRASLMDTSKVNGLFATAVLSSGEKFESDHAAWADVVATGFGPT